MKTDIMKKKIGYLFALTVVAVAMFLGVSLCSVEAEGLDIAIIVEGALTKNGTSEGGYARIFSESHLNALTEHINQIKNVGLFNDKGEALSYDGNTILTLGIKLYNDISYSGVGIGAVERDYKGSILGNGFSLNLTAASLVLYGEDINSENLIVKGSYPLIASLRASSESNFRDVTCMQSISGLSFAGSLISKACGSGKIIVSRCFADNISINGDCAGGFVGHSAESELLVINSFVSGEISGNFCGGIAGFSDGRIAIDAVTVKVKFKEGKRAAICPYANNADVNNINRSINCQGLNGADLFLVVNDLAVRNVRICSISGTGAVFAERCGTLFMENCTVTANSKGENAASIALCVDNAEILNSRIYAKLSGVNVGGLFTEANSMSLINVAADIIAEGENVGGIVYSATEISIDTTDKSLEISVRLIADIAGGIAVYTEQGSVCNSSIRAEITAKEAGGLFYAVGEGDSLSAVGVTCEISIAAKDEAAGFILFAEANSTLISDITAIISITASKAFGIIGSMSGECGVSLCTVLFNIKTESEAAGIVGVARGDMIITDNLFCGEVAASTLSSTVLSSTGLVNVQNNSFAYKLTDKIGLYSDFMIEDAVFKDNVFFGENTSEFLNGNITVCINGLMRTYGAVEAPFVNDSVNAYIYNINFVGFKEGALPKNAGVYIAICTIEDFYTAKIIKTFAVPFFILKESLDLQDRTITLSYEFSGEGIVPEVNLDYIGNPLASTSFILYDANGNRIDEIAGEHDINGVFYNWKNNIYYIDYYIKTVNYVIIGSLLKITVSRISTPSSDTSFYPFFTEYEESKVFDGKSISFQVVPPGLGGISYYVTYSGKSFDGNSILNSTIPPILPGKYTANLYINVPQGYTYYYDHSGIVDSFKFEIFQITLVIKPTEETVYVGKACTPEIVITGFVDNDNIYSLGGFNTLYCQAVTTSKAGTYTVKAQGTLISVKYGVVFEESNCYVIKYSAEKINESDIIIKTNGSVLEIISERTDLLYSVDGGTFQRNPYFKGLSEGAHTLAVKSIETAYNKESEPVFIEFTVSGFPYSIVITASVVLVAAIIMAFIYSRKNKKSA